jgi:FkbM family methyltransferase
LLSLIKKIIRSILYLLGYQLKCTKTTEQSDDPYYAISILLDKEKALTIIDAGASIGDISQNLSEMFPLATVHSIEPYPPFHAQLEKVASENRRILVNKLALSDENGSRLLQINKSEGTNSLLKSNDKGKEIYGDMLSNIGEIEVQCQTLDDFLTENSIEQVDLLKLDLQGSELPALKGATKALKDGKIKCILCEIMFQAHYKSQPSASEILNTLMNNHDYNLFNFYQHHHHKGYLCQVDALFFHKSIHQSVLIKADAKYQNHSLIPL